MSVQVLGEKGKVLAGLSLMVVGVGVGLKLASSNVELTAKEYEIVLPPEIDDAVKNNKSAGNLFLGIGMAMVVGSWFL